MSQTIHLTNGIIIHDPVLGSKCNTLTIQNGFVHEINSKCPADAEKIDLHGECAIPAFIDSHIHLLLAASFYGAVNLQHCQSKDDFQSALRESFHTVEDDRWLVASGWSVEHLGTMPTKAWFPDDFQIPTICYQADLHRAVVNIALLNRLSAQQIQQLEALPGGHRVNDGIVMEDALFNILIPLVPPPTQIQLIASIKNAVQELHSLGITLVGTMENFCDISSIFIHLQKEKAIRLRMMCLDEPTPDLLEQCKSIHQDSFLKITGFKTFLDGSFGSRTARMYSDWLGSGGRGVWAGHAANNSLKDWVDVVSTAGFAPVLHAIGDEAVGLALQVIQDVDPSLVPRIEHAQCIASSDIEKVGNKWFGVQPLHEPDDRAIATKSLDGERLYELHNWRRMIDHGAKLSFGSDWPVVTPHPLRTMKIAIQQGVTPQEALVASTSNAAISLRSPQAGNLHIGSYGDIVVLDKNPLDCNWKESVPSVKMTLQAGSVVYKKEQQHAS